MEALGKIFYALILMVVVSIVSAIVVCKLWLWIVVPVFEVSPITIGAAFGLSVLVGYFKANFEAPKEAAEEENDVKELTYGAARVIVVSGFTLLLGWIASMCI